MKAIHPRLRPFRVAPVLAGIAVLTACAAPQKPPAPAAAPLPAPPPPIAAPAPPEDWRDAPRTPGDWHWSPAAGKSQASYGTDAAAPLATLKCDRDRGAIVLARSTVVLARSSVAPADPAPLPMALVTTTTTRALMSDPALAAPGWLAVSFPTDDPILDAMAFSRGRFALEAAGFTTLYLPSWPEVSRVIEDCR